MQSVTFVPAPAPVWQAWGSAGVSCLALGWPCLARGYSVLSVGLCGAGVLVILLQTWRWLLRAQAANRYRLHLDCQGGAWWLTDHTDGESLTPVAAPAPGQGAWVGGQSVCVRLLSPDHIRPLTVVFRRRDMPIDHWRSLCRLVRAW